jgi:hypothetical protein
MLRRWTRAEKKDRKSRREREMLSEELNSVIRSTEGSVSPSFFMPPHLFSFTFVRLPFWTQVHTDTDRLTQGHGCEWRQNGRERVEGQD